MTSKIKVDNIENQCGGAVVTKCGGTTTISGTVVKSNTLQASDAGNIISQSGTTITLGASGDTINLASGASQSGFGRTGTVDWQTGSIKTATFTAVSGEGYFANTSGGAFTMNLPAGVAGAIVSVVDYTNTFQTNGLTISPNGTEKIGGTNATVTLTTEGQSVTLVYVDATEGWKNTMDSTSNIIGTIPFLTASVSGACNTLTTSGNCKIATFLGPGTFTVCQASTTPANNVVSYMIVAGGGGGGGGSANGGGGAGGFREFKSPITPYTASPRSGSTPVSVTAQGYTVVVGAGGGSNGNGNNSSVLGITSALGGAGAGGVGGSGGSGGGSGRNVPTGTAGGVGNTPPVSPPQGSNGGAAYNAGGGDHRGGGGGGVTVNGCSGTCSGNGGTGITTSITSSPVTRGGGGGGGAENNPAGSGGSGGGGAGSRTSSAGSAATVNTGSGGGGAGYCGGSAPGGNGGSGIVVIRYKFQ
jgi:hypothetical protein